MGSLSARRAWIEIECLGVLGCLGWSLSARRAWIEIAGLGVLDVWALRSLSARRAWIEILNQGQHTIHPPRRSPQGERG